MSRTVNVNEEFVVVSEGKKDTGKFAVLGDGGKFDTSVIPVIDELQEQIIKEVTERTESDKALQTNIDTETSARISADQQLQRNIEAEASTRTTADKDLQDQISKEITARTDAVQELQAEFAALKKISGVPTGAVEYFAMTAAPDGWLKADGSAISRTDYATLFTVIGTMFGAGDDSTTFNLPDLRGEFIRGFDDGRAIDASRLFGSTQGDAIRNITGTTNYIEIGGTEIGTSTGAFNQTYLSGAGAWGTGNNARATLSFDASNIVPTASENRPRNIALLACIKY